MKIFFFVFVKISCEDTTMDSHAQMCVSMYVGSLGVEGRRVVYVTIYSTVELREEA